MVFYHNKGKYWRSAWTLGYLLFLPGWLFYAGADSDTARIALGGLAATGGTLLLIGAISLLMGRRMLEVDHDGVTLYPKLAAGAKTVHLSWNRVQSAGMGTRGAALERGRGIEVFYFAVDGPRPWEGRAQTMLWDESRAEVWLTTPPKKGFSAVLAAVAQFRPHLAASAAAVRARTGFNMAQIPALGYDLLLFAIVLATGLLIVPHGPGNANDFVNDLAHMRIKDLAGVRMASFNRFPLPADLQMVVHSRDNGWIDLVREGKRVRADTELPSEERFAKAEGLYLDALSRLMKVLGWQAVRTRDMRNLFGEIDTIFRTRRRYSQLEPHLQRQIDIYRMFLGESSVTTGLAHRHLGNLYKTLSRHDEMAAEYRLAASIYRANGHEEWAQRLEASLAVGSKKGPAITPRTSRANLSGERRVVSTNPPSSPGETFAYRPRLLIATRRDGVYLLDTRGERRRISRRAMAVEVMGGRIFVLHRSRLDGIQELTTDGTLVRSISIPPQVPYYIEFSVLHSGRFALLDNQNDKVHFIDDKGTYITSSDILPEADKHLQNMDGIVVGNRLVVSETGNNELLVIDLDTYESRVMRSLKHRQGWLGAISYEHGNYFLCQSRQCYLFAEQDHDMTPMVLLNEGAITGIAVHGPWAFVTVNRTGRVYRVTLSNGSTELLAEGFASPQDIERL